MGAAETPAHRPASLISAALIPYIRRPVGLMGGRPVPYRRRPTPCISVSPIPFILSLSQDERNGAAPPDAARCR